MLKVIGLFMSRRPKKGTRKCPVCSGFTVGGTVVKDNRKFVVGLECRTLLQESSYRHLPVTITSQQDKRWYMYNSNLLALESNKLIFAQPVCDTPELPASLEQGQEIAVTFKKGYHKCLFVTRVMSSEQFEYEPDVFVPAMTAYCPQQIEKIQRRHFQRAEAPQSEPVTVSISCSANPDGEQIRWGGTLLDLSAGGLAIKVSKSQVPMIQDDQQVQLRFVPLPQQEPLFLEARYRHTTQTQNSDELVMGFQIVGLEMTEQGRNNLRRISRIVNVYQRQQKISLHPNLVGRK